ncbi:MAG: NAD(P)/FAD-dependent oxidoreductase [bacterium]
MKRIAVIGGGYTGLTAAYRLSQAGYTVTIYEKSEDFGGLTSGFEIQGQNLEKTYHHIFRTDKDIINLAKELGIGDKLLWLKSSMGILSDGQIWEFGTPKSLLKFKPLAFINRIRYGITLLYLAKSNNWKKFEKVPAYKWVEKWSGKQAMNVIWEPLLKGKFDRFYNRVSMAWLWARIHTRGNSQEKGGEKLGYFSGGFNTFTQKLIEELKKNGVNLINNADITYLSSNLNSDDDMVKLKIKRDGKESTEVFHKVIITIPSFSLARIIEGNVFGIEDYIKKLDSIDYIGAVVAIFTSDQELGKYYWNNINDTNIPFLAFINHTKLVDKSVYNNKNIYYIGSYVDHNHKYFEMKDEDIMKDWFNGVKKIFPEFTEEKIIDKKLFKFKYAQHIVDTDYAEKIPHHKTPLKGVYLANFSQIYPEDRGTNFAVREGNLIAKMLISEEKN